MLLRQIGNLIAYSQEKFGSWLSVGKVCSTRYLHYCMLPAVQGRPPLGTGVSGGRGVSVAPAVMGALRPALGGACGT